MPRFRFCVPPVARANSKRPSFVTAVSEFKEPVILRDPAVMAVAPAYVFAPLRVSGAPRSFTSPVPDIAFDTVVSLLRLNTKDALLVTAPVPREPVVPPVPTWTLPSLMVSAPVSFLAPDRKSVPAPIFVKSYAPLRVPLSAICPSVAIVDAAAKVTSPLFPAAPTFEFTKVAPPDTEPSSSALAMLFPAKSRKPPPFTATAPLPPSALLAPRTKVAPERMDVVPV